MIDSLLHWDTEVFVFFNSLGSTTWDSFWMAYTSTFVWIPFYAFLLYLVFKNAPLKTCMTTIVLIVLMVVVTDQTSNLFKISFLRLRPCNVAELMDRMRLVKPHCGGQYGFFSAHASNSMGIAVLIGLILRKHYKYLIHLMVVWALVMGYSRIYIGVHYPLDVLVGFFVGGFTGLMIYRLRHYIITNFTFEHARLKIKKPQRLK